MSKIIKRFTVEDALQYINDNLKVNEYIFIAETAFNGGSEDILPTYKGEDWIGITRLDSTHDSIILIRHMGGDGCCYFLTPFGNDNKILSIDDLTDALTDCSVLGYDYAETDDVWIEMDSDEDIVTFKIENIERCSMFIDGFSNEGWHMECGIFVNGVRKDGHTFGHYFTDEELKDAHTQEDIRLVGEKYIKDNYDVWFNHYEELFS